jgi:catechol 2,3-dioxygenase-like lactoylglutathione lyase family enzyme
MLNNINAVANIPVKDIEVARKFYGGTLGLKEVGREGSELIAYRSGNSDIYVYHSDYAGTNRATALTWSLDKYVESVVAELKAKGIRFEHYENLPDMRLEGDLHVGGGMKVAWFKDPDGNILNLAQKDDSKAA